LSIVKLMRFFRQRASPLLGVDISASAIRIIELARSANGWHVAHFAIHDLPRNTIREGAIVQADLVIEGLRDALQKSGTKLREAAMALPSSLVIRKIISLPSDLSEDELELQIEVEAEQTLPFPTHELNLDFGITGISTASPSHVDVMLVATKKETIAERQAIAEAAGIKPLIIDIESQALITTLISSDSANESTASHARAILQIGRDSSYFFIANHQTTIFEHELDISYQRLNKEIERNPEQSLAVAEVFCAAVCQEFKRALQLYSTNSQYVPIDKFFLSGPEKSLYRLPSMMKEQLSITAVFANPFAIMKFTSDMDKSILQKEASAWLVACGLAMRDRVL